MKEMSDDGDSRKKENEKEMDGEEGPKEKEKEADKTNDVEKS